MESEQWPGSTTLSCQEEYHWGCDCHIGVTRFVVALCSHCPKLGVESESANRTGRNFSFFWATAARREANWTTFGDHVYTPWPHLSLTYELLVPIFGCARSASLHLWTQNFLYVEDWAVSTPSMCRGWAPWWSISRGWGAL